MRHLPPVRRWVPLRGVDAGIGRAALINHFGRSDVELCGSGAQALAAAILYAIKRRQPLKAPAEVIVPAYGCPDVIAACVFAGARPRLVDTAAEAWGYDPQALRKAVGPSTAAILAMNLLGVGDDVDLVRETARLCGALVIQDSAQFFPLERERAWLGDYVVLSFGRGKPLNALGGGALIGPPVEPNPFLHPTFARCARRWLLCSTAAAAAFNASTHPRIYSSLCKLPGLALGATYYRPLGQLESWNNDSVWRRLGAAFQAYAADARKGDELWREALEELRGQGARPVFLREGGGWPDRLLRVPVMMPSRSVRDAAATTLLAYGVSAMYGEALPQITGIPSWVRSQGPFPNAVRLAERLLTLPAHPWVTASEVAHVRQTIRDQLHDA